MLNSIPMEQGIDKNLGTDVDDYVHALTTGSDGSYYIAGSTQGNLSTFYETNAGGTLLELII